MPLTPAARLPEALYPQPGSLRYGLFNVAPPQVIAPSFDDENLPDHAFGSGIFYDPVGCGTAHLYPIDCDPPVEKDFDANSGEVQVDPFVVYSTLVCGTPGSRVQYYADKTARRLLCSEQHAVEEALWTGSAGNGPFITDPAGPYGAPTDVGGGGAFASIVDAVAALEQHAHATVPYGYAAHLHATPAVAAYAAAEHQIVTAGHGFAAVWGTATSEPMLRTPQGSKWVFGGGYPGTGPAGAAPGAGQTYIWVTGLVTTWRDQIWTPPDPLRSQYDRVNNQLNLIAERRYLATFDCFHAYALVDIPIAAVP